ncbi:DUF397 domain-containing protein [Streptomyces sp. NBC_01497]|uniref:DUF397 domain-containing protein n=1 Tax=Streptomyces sp. NBC_01497 TaxID=2903885 RepID=UPI002E31D156|nr:DUF397 domain-containing protein [Streptomyces sp. NBC_01497]
MKSSYPGNNNRVEVAALPRGGRAVRDSKDPRGPVPAFAPGAAVGAFLASLASDTLISG